MPGTTTMDGIRTLLGLAGLPETVITTKVATDYLRDFQRDPDSTLMTVETVKKALPAMVSVALERSLRAVERV
jgi:hypothetical protein